MPVGMCEHLEQTILFKQAFGQISTNLFYAKEYNSFRSNRLKIRTVEIFRFLFQIQVPSGIVMSLGMCEHLEETNRFQQVFHQSNICELFNKKQFNSFR